MTEPPEILPGIAASDAKRAARNASALIVASVLSKGLLFLWQIVLAPWLSPADYGIYNTIGALLVIGASVTSFSMGLIIIRDVAQNPEKANRYWTAMLFIQTILSVVAYMGINGAALAAGYSDTIRGYTALAGLSLFVDMIGNMNYDLLIAQEKMLKTSVVDVVHIVVRIALAALALLFGWGLLGIYAMTIVSGIGRSVVLLWINWRGGLRLRWPVQRDIAVPLLINSAPLALTAFLSLLYQHTDKLMTTAIIGETNTGYLGPAFVISFGVIEVLSTTVLVAVYPMMSRYYEGGGNPTFGFMIEKLSFFMFAMSLPIALTLSIYADAVIAFLYRSGQYAPTAGILSVLIWYTMTTMVGNVFAKGMLIQNRQRLLMVIRVAGLVLNVGLTYVLLVQYRDPRGAALASIVAEILVVALMFWRFEAAGWTWQRVVPAFLKMAMLGIIAGIIMVFLKDTNVIIGMAGGLAIYFVGLVFAPILRSDDWDLLYRLVAAMPFGPLVRRYWKRDIAVNW